ncbi:Secreted RxLR effector peptide protein [Phytophthora palmivora]|uniref:RxLR effector protein n=1 Tax=Phytophthora palmivora TaxID=4796 RepID=A0A2P4YF08_9STRA|nr:Secreted RxLR effector peptide protein [Phytophthora palmivora]
MRLHRNVLVLVIVMLAIANALSSTTGATTSSENALSFQKNGHITRFLRSNHLDKDDTNEERAATMNFAGFLRDSTETRQWLQFWFNKGESVTNVAAKLKVYNLPQNTAISHENWNALVKYMRMTVEGKAGKKYAKFGTGYQTEKKTKEMLMKWILADDSIESVAKTLKVLDLTEHQLKVHRNYNAFMTFLTWRKEWQHMRATNFGIA